MNSEKNNAETNLYSIDYIVDCFYVEFYKRKPDSAIKAYVANLTKDSAQPINDFFKIAKNSIEFQFRDAYVPLFGFYKNEGEFRWFDCSASIVVKRLPVYLSIPSNFPCTQKLIIKYHSNTEEVVLKPGEAIKIRNSSECHGQVYSIEASYQFVPSEHGEKDNRSLAFQISLALRDTVLLRKNSGSKINFPLIAVSGSIKESRVLKVVSNALNSINIPCIHIEFTDPKFLSLLKQLSCPPVFIVASADTFYLCERHVDLAKYIYIEHGIAPFKGYTYGLHYLNYDHVMLPSSFWRNRILKLHGNLKSSDVVGYPVISTVDLCDKKDIDVLFAPTWSLTIEQTKLISNLVGVALKSGLHVAYVSHPDSLANINSSLLSNLVQVKDVYDALSRTLTVVTDYSSVGIEAATIGLPVFIFKPHSLDDFDASFNHDGKLEVPHSDGVIFDIGPEVTPENLIDEIRKVLSADQESFHSAKRKEWAEFCHSVPYQKSPDIAAQSVSRFLYSIGWFSDEL